MGNEGGHAMSNNRLKSNQDYWSNTAALLGAVKCYLKEHGSQGREGTGKAMSSQESLESVKRRRLEYFHREFIPRGGKPHREGCFPPKQT